MAGLEAGTCSALSAELRLSRDLQRHAAAAKAAKEKEEKAAKVRQQQQQLLAGGGVVALLRPAEPPPVDKIAQITEFGNLSQGE